GPGADRTRGSGAARGRATYRGRDRAAAGPLVLDAAARSRRPREADGPRPARPDRGTLPARHAVPDRLQRLRAPDAAEGARRSRLGGGARATHAPRVPPRRPLARAAPARDAAGDHGDLRRADRPPRGGARTFRVAADPQEDPPHPRRGDPAP